MLRTPIILKRTNRKEKLDKETKKWEVEWKTGRDGIVDIKIINPKFKTYDMSISALHTLDKYLEC